MKFLDKTERYFLKYERILGKITGVISTIFHSERAIIRMHGIIKSDTIKILSNQIPDRLLPEERKQKI